MSEAQKPGGELLLRTLAMPAYTNANGDIFGGWIMSQMDIAGGIIAKEASHGRVVTIAADSMKFIEPVAVGDTVCCYGEILKIGTTSITTALEVWVTKSYASTDAGRNNKKVTEAVFTYVAVDDAGNKRKVPKQ